MAPLSGRLFCNLRWTVVTHSVIEQQANVCFLKSKHFCILIASMRIRVLLFGQLKDIIGRSEDSLEVQPGTSLADLMAGYARQFPRFGPMRASIACSVNREYASTSVVLR